jgi:hypothetical protein
MSIRRPGDPPLTPNAVPVRDRDTLGCDSERISAVPIDGKHTEP